MRNFRLIGAVVLGVAFLWPTFVTPAAEATASDFTGAVNVDGCSGSVVRMPNSADGDRALVLTNGHCYEGAWPVPDEVLAHRPSHRVIGLLDGEGKPVTMVHVAEASYVTMTGTDMALYRLHASYKQLERDHGVHARTVSARPPEPGRDIRVVSGSIRKVFSCRIDKLVYRVLETGYVTKDVLRYTPACDTGPGTSGSPVVDAASGEIVGINNTSNREGGQCTADNPCEMNRDGVITVHKGASYGTQAYWLTTCMGPGSELDLDKHGCLLPKP
ncbi:S1 family peptidase [Actinomadura madurae]|uniref:S1 family peptidase n=1 Tax=Actinomadura madurae TaxID=1993 RepID=UPI000D8D96A4|nr:serine protease [Actinomadura madurae]SPT51254.1 V8-like Glu-specific endopeptidase [Actinomadura madurae]